MLYSWTSGHILNKLEGGRIHTQVFQQTKYQWENYYPYTTKLIDQYKLLI